METAAKEARTLRDTDHNAPVVKKLTATARMGTAMAQTSCYRCGRTNHRSDECKFRQSTCNACGKTGHIAPVCRGKPKAANGKPGSTRKHGAKKYTKTHMVDNAQELPSSSDGSDNEFQLYRVGKSALTDQIIVPLTLNGQQLDMEVDTGAALSIISEATQQRLFPMEMIHPTDVILKTYSNETLEVKGKLHLHVKYEDQTAKLTLIVVAGKGPSLLGRNWLKYIRLNWTKIFSIRNIQSQSLEALLSEHQPLFSKDMGLITPFAATLHMPPNTMPKFFKPRPVPFSIRDAMSRELADLEKQGIISPVSHSKWAAPIVPVPKKDGKFRICGDYKVTINQALSVEEYPLPTPEELFSTLSGGTVFSKLDLSQAYLQVPMDEKSKEFLTVNTHQGLYRYERLPFRVASTPAIFQRLMDTVLQGVKGVACYIDDILISTATHETYLSTLKEVFNRLQKHGFRLKLEKCEFFKSSIEYLGHVISAEGIKPVPSKVEAIVQAPTPQNVQQVRSFLGLLNYYGEFLPKLASLLHPLNSLLQRNEKFEWTTACDTAFQTAKAQIASARVLTHFNPALPIALAADASQYGIGAVISHLEPDGTERPIAFASRSLTKSEVNYAQLEKEALSLIFGIKKFHRYLYGCKFTLITDHQPLTTILGPKKGIPSLSAARLQRWAVLLSAYTYDIKYKSTREHGNADGLSCLPLPHTGPPEEAEGPTTFNIGQVQALPITSGDIEHATARDPILSKVYRYAQMGWPNQITRELQIFKDCQMELTIQGGFLLWGARVIIPSILQNQVLESLHISHPGITRMKAIAHSHFWWHGLDSDIEQVGRRPRRMWVRSIFLRRRMQGEYHNLVQEMRLEDVESFFRYFRMVPQQFDTLLHLVAPHICKKDSRWRESISSGERLAITLRYVS